MSWSVIVKSEHLTAGWTDYLSKPLRGTDLRAALERGAVRLVHQVH